MSAEVQKQPAAKVIAMGPAVRSVRLVHSTPFAGTESETIRMEPGLCTRYYAARLEADGQAVAITAGQRADGMVFERDWHDRADSNKLKSERIFVAWSNVRCVVY